MKSARVFVVVVSFLCLALCSFAQVTHIAITAGSEEDKALQAISSETEAQKKIALLQKFNEEHAANKQAVAYGYWQMLQTYQANGENEKAFAAGEKAAELAPGNMDILVSLCAVADSLHDYESEVKYAAKGGAAYNGIATQPKPAATSAADWATQVHEDQISSKQAYEYLEAAAMNAVSGENDPKKRLDEIQVFTTGFPSSRFDVQISQLAMASLQALNDTAKSIEFGEKALKANPNSVPTLLLLANAFAADPKNLAKGVEYAQRAVKLVKVGPDSPPEQRMTAGVAKSTLGYALLNQDKALLALPELKEAVDFLQGHDSVYEEALYRLGFAYAKLGKREDAKAALQKCAAINGPYLPMAQDLLNRMSTPAKKK